MLKDEIKKLKKLKDHKLYKKKIGSASKSVKFMN
jgi:hypothetical protein